MDNVLTNQTSVSHKILEMVKENSHNKLMEIPHTSMLDVMQTNQIDVLMVHVEQDNKIVLFYQHVIHLDHIDVNQEDVLKMLQHVKNSMINYNLVKII